MCTFWISQSLLQFHTETTLNISVFHLLLCSLKSILGSNEHTSLSPPRSTRVSKELSEHTVWRWPLARRAAKSIDGDRGDIGSAVIKWLLEEPESRCKVSTALYFCHICVTLQPKWINSFNTHMKGTHLKLPIISGCSVYTSFMSIYLIHCRGAVMLLESFKQRISI